MSDTTNLTRRTFMGAMGMAGAMAAMAGSKVASASADETVDTPHAKRGDGSASFLTQARITQIFLPSTPTKNSMA